MSAVNLADVISRDQYQREVTLASLRKSVFWNSGVVVNDSQLSQMLLANVGGVFSFDYWKDLSDTEARTGDDSDTQATSEGILSGSDTAVGCYRNQSWEAKNITANLSSIGDPMAEIASREGAYWARQSDLTTMALIKGVQADNVANDAGDMSNVQTDTAITVQMVNDTVQTAGDAQDFFGVMICHSQIRTALKNAGVTDKVYSDDGTYLYEALSGLRLVVTDSVEIPSAGNYVSYIVGTGAVGYGQGRDKMPNNIYFDPKTGNGAGAESMWSRKVFSLHPYGFDFRSASMAGVSPTNGEFELAANWARNVERKRIPIAFLTSGV